MKKIISGFLIFAAATFAADARGINLRSFDDLDRRSDIIVVAEPISSKDTDEQTNLPHISPAIPVVGLSSEFEVGFVLKGDDSLKKLIVHHYRLANSGRWTEFALASFDPKESTRYLLFLQREPDGRYAPFDQVDPAWSSMLKLSGTEWDKMQLEDFQNWLNAKKWLRERPNLGSAMSPEITLEGRGDGSLHEAAMNGKLEKARALIKTNPDLVNSQASYGSMTPLQFAAEYGHKDVAELLLANKANIEAKSYGGWSPLLNAVFGGHKDMVELLLTNKADVNYEDNAGRTPLHVAAENGYTEIAALLLANGANVNAKSREGSREGYTPLHIAAVLGHKDLVDLLVANKAEYNIQDAAAIGDLERVKAMLKDDPDLVFSRDFSGQTALHWAVIQGRTETDMVKLLLANKADVNAKASNSGWTPLHMAVLSGHKDIVELLLAGGADVNAKSKYQTPLRVAESQINKDMADLLRQHGGHD
jgi:ankyrin repeat protein